MFLLPLHILAGAIGLLGGAIALGTQKGHALHRKSGLVFAVAMLVMAALGGWLAIGPHVALSGAMRKAAPLSVFASLLCAYLVSTAWLAVRPAANGRAAQGASLVAGLLVAVFGVGAAQALDGAGSHGEASNAYVFVAVALLGVIGDLRQLLGGELPRVRRIARHVWRIGFAMFMATASFFLGQAKFFPAPVRQSGMLALPVLVVVGMLVYWMVKLLWPKRRAAVQ